METGVFLKVTPQANLETGEIILAVQPKVVQARTGATFITNNGSITFKDPEERGAQSILRIKDGETTIIGGLLRETGTDTITKLPILGDLPLIGGAFRHKDKTADERELVIFLTPRVLTEDYTISSKTAFKHIEREQEIPLVRRNAVEKALSNFEKLNF